MWIAAGKAETPAAFMIAARFLWHCDCFTVGCFEKA